MSKRMLNSEMLNLLNLRGGGGGGGAGHPDFFCET